LSQILGVDIVLNIAVLVGKDHVGVPVLVAGCLEVVDLQVFIYLVRIILEEVAAVRGHLTVYVALQGGELLSTNKVLELTLTDFLLDELINLTFGLVHFWVLAGIVSGQCSEKLLASVNILEHIEVLFVFS
jgi:hypothetical protein